MMSDASIIALKQRAVKGGGKRETSMMNASKQHEALVKLCTAALMTAIVFAGNYLRITMPVAVGGVTAFTLANILCALSGLLLGPWWGFCLPDWAPSCMT